MSLLALHTGEVTINPGFPRLLTRVSAKSVINRQSGLVYVRCAASLADQVSEIRSKDPLTLPNM